MILFDGLSKQIILDKEEKRGPSTKSPKEALEGFLRSNKITEKDVYKKQTEKGEFYFFLKPKEKIDTKDILQKEIPIILEKIDKYVYGFNKSRLGITKRKNNNKNKSKDH